MTVGCLWHRKMFISATNPFYVPLDHRPSKCEQVEAAEMVYRFVPVQKLPASYVDVVAGLVNLLLHRMFVK